MYNEFIVRHSSARSSITLHATADVVVAIRTFARGHVPQQQQQQPSFPVTTAVDRRHTWPSRSYCAKAHVVLQRQRQWKTFGRTDVRVRRTISHGTALGDLRRYSVDSLTCAIRNGIVPRKTTATV